MWLAKAADHVFPNQQTAAFQDHQLSLDLNSLQTELARLVDQIHVVQQQLRGTSPLTPSPFTTAHRLAPVPTFVSASPPQTPLLSPQLLQRELKHQPATPESKKEEVPAVPEPKYVPLREAYLSFNAWCDQLEALDIPLAEEIDGEFRVSSSHAISFRQFGYRLLRRGRDDPAQEQLQHYLDRFEQLRQDGVDTRLSDEPESAPDGRRARRFLTSLVISGSRNDPHGVYLRARNLGRLAGWPAGQCSCLEKN